MITEKRYLDTVTIVIPMYNEEKYIEGLVDSILNQDYDKEKIEVVFVDGKSEDKTVEKLKLALEGKKLKYNLMYNPERITPKSVNMGIKSAKNDIIIRLDAHSKYPNNYVSKCVYYLNNTDADNVGCLIKTESLGIIGKAISGVLSSKFGVGNSKFRTNSASGYVDTVPFGTFKKELFEKIGYFNEELIRSEDNEFNNRIIKNGGKIYLFDDICVTYYPRDTIIGLTKMAYENGKEIIYTNLIQPGTMKIRHLIPLIFVIGLIVGSFFLILRLKIMSMLYVFMIALYLILDVAFTLKNVCNMGANQILCIMIYPLFHISYGIGSIIGILKILKKVVKKYIETLLKNNKVIYNIYSFSMNSFLGIIRAFTKVDDKIILFNSFGGKKYDDSPKAIFEYMVENPKYSTYKFYWGINDPKKVKIANATVIKNNTLKYFKIALRAKYWITNSSIERGLKFKNKKTIYINTWHGTALKKIGIDMQDDEGVKLKVTQPDLYYSQSEYDIKIFSKAFNVPKEKIVLSGLPRNDELCHIQENRVIEIKKKIGLPLDKKIILYAPTYREYERDATGCVQKIPINLQKWREKLSEEFIVLFRAHYEINKIMGINDDNFIRNVSDYNNLNELLIVSDMLISDYSSIMVDYSILERPIFSYAYDYDKYKEKRGLYINLNKELPNGYYTEEDKLLDEIEKCNYDEQKMKTLKFKQKYVQVSGEARKYIDNIILN